VINGKSVRTRYEWLDLLAAESRIISRIDLKSTVADEVYSVGPGMPSANVDALNLAGSEEHNKKIALYIDILSASGVHDDIIKKILTDLTSRNTYGTYSELAVYGSLSDHGLTFDIQVHCDQVDILNPNGADLDGKLMLSQEILFDIKAFGFHAHLIEKLTERLSSDLSPNYVTANESWDISIQTLEKLLGRDYKALKEDLEKHNLAKRGPIRFISRQPTRVQISSHVLDPIALADKNADYAFRYAKQFSRNKPFLLLFSIHPWFGGIVLHNNFGGYVDNFTTKFASNVFSQNNSSDSTPFGVTRGTASTLLSGIGFIDSWQGQPENPAPRHRLFLNPNAVHPLSSDDIKLIVAAFGAEIQIR